MRKLFRRSALTLLALFLIATIVIWVRSYWAHDQIRLVWAKQHRINRFTTQFNAHRTEVEWGKGSIELNYFYLRKYPNQPVSDTTLLKVVHDPPRKPIIAFGETEWIVQFQRLGFCAWKESSGLNDILPPGLDGGDQQWVVVLPIGFLTALSALLILLTWMKTRKRFPIGRCSSCGYDLTDNVSGVCPECGTQSRQRIASQTTDRARHA